LLLENGKKKTHHSNNSTNNIPTVSHYSWTKESRTLDKKLNGKKKTSEIKKKVLYGKEMSSDSQKLKKKKKKKKIFLKGKSFWIFFKN